jgi:hypothetical protein
MSSQRAGKVLEPFRTRTKVSRKRRLLRSKEELSQRNARTFLVDNKYFVGLATNCLRN